MFVKKGYFRVCEKFEIYDLQVVMVVSKGASEKTVCLCARSHVDIGQASTC